jgi:DNA polymerase-3 subunit epsilon
MEFVAIDVETANADMSSICQIGIAKFKNNILVGEWCSLIDPEDYFDSTNICIHGITKEDVAGSPKIDEIAGDIYGLLDGTLTVCHTHFDRVSIGRAFDKYGIRIPEPKWLDTAKVARRTWDRVLCGGYGLKNICRMIGYEFQHHDALEDAKASGHILIAAMNETGLKAEDWLEHVKKPIGRSGVRAVR